MMRARLRVSALPSPPCESVRGCLPSLTPDTSCVHQCLRGRPGLSMPVRPGAIWQGEHQAGQSAVTGNRPASHSADVLARGSGSVDRHLAPWIPGWEGRAFSGGWASSILGGTRHYIPLRLWWGRLGSHEAGGQHGHAPMGFSGEMGALYMQ